LARVTRHPLKKAGPAARTTRGALSTIKLTLPWSQQGLVITNLALTSDPMHWEDRFIAACNSWSEFWERAKKLPSKSEKGAVFERLTQLYLQITTIRDVPPNVRRLLDLPTLDEGIDFIARTRQGKYWAIQSKFLSLHDKPFVRTIRFPPMSPFSPVRDW
jgi:hypothetical protein